jgi:hypothetical protein
MARHNPPETCPECGALLGDVAEHSRWHREQSEILVRLLRASDAARHLTAAAADDDRPTAKLPPIRETVLRRPPAAVRELKGPELLRALADAMDADGLDVEDLDR